MKVNISIKEVLEDIGKRSISYMNEHDKRKKYIGRITDYYVNNLTREERIYIFAAILDELSHKEASLNEETLILKNNLKIRLAVFLFTGVGILMILGNILFIEGYSVSNLLKHVFSLF